MSRFVTLALYYLAVFLQAGTYGLTFMLPKLFASFGANEKDVGAMLLITAVTTIISVYYSGHFTDWLGRMPTMSLSGFSIAVALFLFSRADSLGFDVVIASALLGFGWSLFYAIGPIILTRVTQPDERVRSFAMLSVFMMAGFGLSPVMASLMEDVGLTVADSFTLMAAICVFSGALFLMLKHPIRRIAIDAAVEPRAGLTLGTVGRIMRSRGALPVTMACLGASVFAGMNNFQTVFAEAQSVPYADFFLSYTITVIICRVLLAGFSGGRRPYALIAGLQYIMCASVIVFMVIDGSWPLYILSAIMLGIGYGASYPILVAMAANDAEADLVPQTLQFFALTYFIGIFGFPLLAGWIIVEQGIFALLVVVAILAAVEASMAARRAFSG